MKTETIILIVTNIVVPILVALITSSFQAKKYKKEIELLNVAHENRIRELENEWQHKLEMLQMQYKHEQELENQKMGNAVIEMLSNKVADKIIEQPATQKMINQQTRRSFLKKKRR